MDTYYGRSSRAAWFTSEVACQHDFARGTGGTKRLFVDACFERLADPLHNRPLDADYREELELWRAETGELSRSVEIRDATVDPALGAMLEGLGYGD